MTRYAHKVDSNQDMIVAALRQAGYSVLDLSSVGGGAPDLAVGGIDRQTGLPANWLIEIKTSAGHLNKRQVNWIASWRGPVAVARTIEEALALAGVV